MKIKLFLMLLTIIGVSLLSVENKNQNFLILNDTFNKVTITNINTFDDRGTEEVLFHGAFSHLKSTPATKETTIITTKEISDIVILWDFVEIPLHKEKIINSVTNVVRFD